MIQALCIQKFRNKNNQIIGYRIQDKKGNTIDVKPEQLKQAIKNKNPISMCIAANDYLAWVLRSLLFGLQGW